ncbi:Fe(3+) dicitrate ABC transporter ATP-binding protein FecE [Nesterenkonia flava]
MLRAEDLQLSYGSQRVLQGVTLSLQRGRVHGLVGPNGAGKSTLLRTLAVLQKPARGRVYLPSTRNEPASEPACPGRDLCTLSSRERARFLAYLPQDTSVAFDFPVREVVAMGLYAHLSRFRGPSSGDLARIQHALQRTGTEALAEKSVRSLSGGQRQLVLLAKQLAQRPEIYLLDEPVSALDIAHQLHVAQCLRELAAAGHAVVVVLHDITYAAALCDRITVMHQGRIYDDGTPEHVLTEQMFAEVYRVRARVETTSGGNLTVLPYGVVSARGDRTRRRQEGE